MTRVYDKVERTNDERKGLTYQFHQDLRLLCSVEVVDHLCVSNGFLVLDNPSLYIEV